MPDTMEQDLIRKLLQRQGVDHANDPSLPPAFRAFLQGQPQEPQPTRATIPMGEGQWDQQPLPHPLQPQGQGAPQAQPEAPVPQQQEVPPNEAQMLWDRINRTTGAAQRRTGSMVGQPQQVGPEAPGPQQAPQLDQAQLTPPLAPPDPRLEEEKQARSRDERADMLMGLRTISERLGSMGVQTAGEIRRGIKPEPYSADTLRQMEGQTRNRLTGAERKRFEDFTGYGLSPGADRGMMKDVSPIAAAGMRVKAAAEEGDKNRSLADMRMKLQDLNSRETARHNVAMEDVGQGRTDMMRESMAQRKDLAERLTPKEVQDVSDMDNTIRMAQDLLNRRQKGGFATGPLDRMATAARDALPGVNSPERKAWERELFELINTRIKDITGKQMQGMAEANRIMSSIPNLSDQEPVFDSEMKDMIKNLKMGRENFLNNLESSSRNTTKFKVGGLVFPKTGEKYQPANRHEYDTLINDEGWSPAP